MPKYAPHTLPTDGARPGAQQQERTLQERAQQERAPERVQQQAQRPIQAQRTHPSILLGQHIRRERGMQGVRSYTASIREYLSDAEYRELCASMGVTAETRPVAQTPPPVQHQPPVQQPPPVQQQPPANQAQMLQTLAQLMPLLSGGAGAGGGGMNNPLGQLMNGGQGGQGFNPGMLSSLLGGQGGGAGGGGGGIDPMMIAQLLGGLNK